MKSIKELLELQMNLPTAEEFLIENDDEDFRLSKSGVYISNMMIEFAKLHVETALKAASEKAKTLYVEPDGCATGDYYEVDKDSILNSYPLNNIK